MVVMETGSSRDRDVVIDLESGTNETIDGDFRAGEGLLMDGEVSDRSFGGEEKMGLLENVRAEKPRKKRPKRPPKPPRPPKTLPMDENHDKVAREISELAMLKRERMERMKALKNMKNSKTTSSSSSNSSFCALIVTILFCLIVIWQAFSQRDSSSASFHGSPESSVGTNGGLISVQFYKNNSTMSPHSSSSASTNNVGSLSGSDGGEEEAS